VDNEERILAGHICDPSCPCMPRRDDQDCDLWVHNEPEAGGYNS
jgi:hypothetical protein